MQPFGPYSTEELRAMRCLILASGNEVVAWSTRLRRSADYLRSLSPAQAEIVAEQAVAIAADPADYGGEAELAAARERLQDVAEGDRAKFAWGEIVAVRRRHYPGQLAG